MTTAFNLLENSSMSFDDKTDPEYAVCYAYVTTDAPELSSAFFAAIHGGSFEAFKTKLPIVRGKDTVACGDWAALLDEEKHAHKAKYHCAKHGMTHWVESMPPGNGYCRACVQEEYDAAPVCPHCGIKRGFAMGTGDCGCEVDPD